MSEFMSYDPWANIVSRNGFKGDELISMLQKSIRRGNEENALVAAYEMYITSPQFEEKMWRRLLSISVEDIGFGNVEAPELIYTLYQMRKEFLYADGDRPMFFIHAIRFLCRQKKERTSDNVKNMVIRKFAHGDIPPVPDYAFDMHTAKGRAMGRDEEHFLTEASRVEPEVDDPQVKKIREQYLEYLRGEKDRTGTPEVAPFPYNTWQY